MLSFCLTLHSFARKSTFFCNESTSDYSYVFFFFCCWTDCEVSELNVFRKVILFTFLFGYRTLLFSSQLHRIVFTLFFSCQFHQTNLFLAAKFPMLIIIMHTFQCFQWNISVTECAINYSIIFAHIHVMFITFNINTFQIIKWIEHNSKLYKQKREKNAWIKRKDFLYLPSTSICIW